MADLHQPHQHRAAEATRLVASEGLPVPVGGLAATVLRSVGTLGAVRGRSIKDLLADPVDGVVKLLLGTLVRVASGRGMTRATHRLGVGGAAQRAAIFVGESIAEGAFYHWYEQRVKGRKPRAAAGYLRASEGELAQALAAVGLSAAGVSWVGRASKSITLVLPAGSRALCYGTHEKLRSISSNGLVRGAYLTPNLELGKARVCELLALPSVAEAVAVITFLVPVHVTLRPIAMDFGRLGGGVEVLTEEFVPAACLSVGAAVALRADAG